MTTRCAYTGCRHEIPAWIHRRRPDGRADDAAAGLARLARAGLRHRPGALGRRLGRRSSARRGGRRPQSADQRCRQGRARQAHAGPASTAARARLLHHPGGGVPPPCDAALRAHRLPVGRRAGVGGPPASAAGTLTVMAGGEEADLARLAPLMRDIAARCTRMGPLGAGLAAKMINQLIVGVGHAMLGEALGLCEKAGIDAARIPECLAGGYADSNVLKAYWPRMVERDFAPRGYVRQLLKDLEMVS